MAETDHMKFPLRNTEANEDGATIRLAVFALAATLLPFPAVALGEEKVIPTLLWIIAAQLLGAVIVAVASRARGKKAILVTIAYGIGCMIAWCGILASNVLTIVYWWLAFAPGLSNDTAFVVSAFGTAITPGVVLAVCSAQVAGRWPLYARS